MSRLFWPASITAGMVALTLYLGVWQVQRLAWKTDLLAQIDRGEAAPPVPLSDHPAQFSRVFVSGTFRPEWALYGVEVRATSNGPALGGQLLRGLERDGSLPVMVDLGWVPEGAPPPDTEGPVTIEGYVRPSEKPIRFGAADDPAHRRFYALDPVAIGKSIGLDEVAPFTIVALGTAHPGRYPEPGTTLPRPVNNHLTYAATWFSMAAAGLVIFTIYARKVLRA